MTNNNSNINYSACALVFTICLFSVLLPFYYIYKFITKKIESKKQKEESDKQLLLENLEEERRQHEYNKLKKETEDKINKKIQDVKTKYPYLNREQALDYINIKESL